MSNITINTKRNEIVITKKFETAAKRFGSPEYKELKEVRADFPTYKVVTRKATKVNEHKGLTYDFMKQYIEANDKDGFIKAEFEKITATSKEAKELNAKAKPYLKVRDWFLNVYPVFAEFEKNREAILEA
jgi:hypothetical protein